ncbi:MAG: signal peptidase I [Clostridia bacterium]|nr:signal peptidase I [Clostridia bacterium]
MNNETNVAAKATKKQKKPKEPMKTSDKVSLIVGIILCAILVPILIFNCVSIITSHATNKPPSFFGNTLLFVNTGSMEPLFMKGDVIIVKTVDPDTIEVGDVISYFENGAKIPTTHRVIKIEDVDGRRYATTAGDWNVSQDYESALASCKTDEEKAELEAKIERKTDENADGYSYIVFEGHEDKARVSLDNNTIIGKYAYSQAPKQLISIMNFMRSVWGWIIFVIIPLIALVTAEIVLRTKRDKKKDKDMDALLAELEALKAQKAAAEAEASAEADTPADVEDTPKDE